MSEAESTPPFEQLTEIIRKPSQPIADLLPRYYECFGENPTYTAERLYDMNGHEVSWMRVDGTITVDITRQGREGQEYSAHELRCACHFAEGVGWQTDKTYGVVTLTSADRCDAKSAVVKLRQQEIRQEYIDRGILDPEQPVTMDAVKTIILDLIGKHRRSEFIEGGSGADFWGGHYYLETLFAIVGGGQEATWGAIQQLIIDKVIQLDGWVVQDYREPKKPMYYDPDAIPEITYRQVSPEEIFALIPKPDEHELDLSAYEQIDDVLPYCLIGLAHTRELATARLHRAIKEPRASHDLEFYRSFLDLGRQAGALAVVAYLGKDDWLVEAFEGEYDTPTKVRTLPLLYVSHFGPDQDDVQALEELIGELYPKEER